MTTFYELLHSANGLDEAQHIDFILVHTLLGRFSHLTEDGNAVFVNGNNQSHIPLLLVDGHENPELRIIRQAE